MALSLLKQTRLFTGFISYSNVAFAPPYPELTLISTILKESRFDNFNKTHAILTYHHHIPLPHSQYPLTPSQISV